MILFHIEKRCSQASGNRKTSAPLNEGKFTITRNSKKKLIHF